MAHLRGTPGNRIEDLECRHQLPRPVNLDPHTPTAHFPDQRRQLVGCGAQAGKIFRPGGYHLPFVFWAGLRRSAAAQACTQRQGTCTYLFHEITALHMYPPGFIEIQTFS